MRLDPLEEVLKDVRAGKPIVMVDDVERENEGDLMIAAEKTTPELINFMLLEGKGLICLSLTAERMKQIGIPLQVTENTSVFGTNFGVSFDAKEVADSGVSARGRSATILAAVRDAATPEEFNRPGYVFPLAAVPGGVLKRRGQTEGSVDISRLAGLKPAGVICEVMNERGVMLRGAELEAYCRKHQLKITSVEEIVQYRLHNEVSIRRIAQEVVPAKLGLSRSSKLDELNRLSAEIPFQVYVYVDDVDDKEHLALVKGEPKDGCLVRIHSECLTGDVFQSKRCDCGSQLDLALEAIFEAGEGIVIYLHQEGRGIGLGNKLRAYELQEQGLDTVDANIHLGFAPDQRDYRVGAQILSDLGISKVRLMTNNPSKMESLSDFGVEIVERVVLPVKINKYNTAYIKTKQQRMGHLFEDDVFKE